MSQLNNYLKEKTLKNIQYFFGENVKTCGTNNDTITSFNQKKMCKSCKNVN